MGMWPTLTRIEPPNLSELILKNFRAGFEFFRLPNLDWVVEYSQICSRYY